MAADKLANSKSHFQRSRSINQSLISLSISDLSGFQKQLWVTLDSDVHQRRTKIISFGTLIICMIYLSWASLFVANLVCMIKAAACKLIYKSVTRVKYERFANDTLNIWVIIYCNHNIKYFNWSIHFCGMLMRSMVPTIFIEMIKLIT